MSHKRIKAHSRRTVPVTPIEALHGLLTGPGGPLEGSILTVEDVRRAIGELGETMDSPPQVEYAGAPAPDYAPLSEALKWIVCTLTPDAPPSHWRYAQLIAEALGEAGYVERRKPS